MILGSHNSMTYLKPKHWWLWPFRFMAKCQDKTIQEQYLCGARLFDIRIKFNKNNTPEFAHGIMTFKGDLFETLNYLNSLSDKIYVRIINERDKNYDLFKQLCMKIQLKYPHIMFIGGVNKKDWKQLFTFNYSLEFIDKYSSWNNDTHLGTGWYFDDIFPRLYAFCLNAHWREKYNNENVYLMQDFIGVY